MIGCTVSIIFSIKASSGHHHLIGATEPHPKGRCPVGIWVKKPRSGRVSKPALRKVGSYTVAMGNYCARYSCNSCCAEESRVIHRSHAVVLCDDCLAVVDDGHDVAQVVADLKGSFADELFFGGGGHSTVAAPFDIRLKDTDSVAAVQVLFLPGKNFPAFFIDG